MIILTHTMLAIATNIPAFVLHGHIYIYIYKVLLNAGKSKDKLCLTSTTSAGNHHYAKISILNLYYQKVQICLIPKKLKKKNMIFCLNMLFVRHYYLAIMTLSHIQIFVFYKRHICTLNNITDFARIGI